MSVPSGARSAVLDRDVLLRSVQSNTALLRRVVDLFDVARVQAMTELRVAAAAGDAPTVRRVAHRVKGSSLSVGGFAAATAAGRALDLAATTDPEALRSALGELATALDDVSRALAVLLAEHGA